MIVLTLLLFALGIQEPSKAAVPGTAVATPAEAKLHADVVTYLELNGAQKRMRDSYPQSLDDARPAMQKQCPSCTPEFFQEYKKRMLVRLDTAPCMAASVAAYEKYLTEKDVQELIALQRAQNAGKPVAPSEELRKKLTSVLSAMMSEIIGKCSEAGAKTGSEVGGEIAKEHPEYVSGRAKPPSPQ